MTPSKIALAVLLLFPIAAFADPSLSVDSNRDVNTSSSSKVGTDKKMSVERNEGAKNTKSRTSESSAEKSREKSTSNARSEATSLSKTYSGEADINSLLIQQFQRHYERASAWDNAAAPIVAFSKCKPTLNLVNDYPVIGYIPDKNVKLGVVGARTGGNVDVNWRHLSDSNGVVGYRQAPNYSAQNACQVLSLEATDAGAKTSLENDCVIPAFSAPVSTGYHQVRQYALCRIAAHYWLTEAAKRITERPAISEDEVASRAEQVFRDMDANAELFASIKEQSKDLWDDASCNNFLSWKGDFNGLNMRCGVFNVVGERIEVNGRPTLSEAAINGSKFKIALSAGSTITDTDEERRARSERLADRESRARSHEDYDSNQNGLSMSKSQSSDRSRTDGKGRSGKTSIGVNPKTGAN